MIRFPKTKTISFASLIFTSAICQVNAQTTVFEDDMEYADTAAMQAAWSNGVGATTERVTQLSFVATPLSSQSPSPASGAVMGLNNGVRYRSLDQTVTDDWTLTYLYLSSSYSRNHSIFLLDSTGTQGYGISFETSSPNAFTGEGFLSINKFDNSTYSDWGTFGTGTVLGSGSDSGHPITGYEVLTAPDSNQNNATYDTANWQDMMTISLSWESATGTLTATVNGVEQTSETDTDFSSFDRIYVRGNTRGYFDDLQVTVIPEPSASAWLSGILCLGLAGLAASRRSRK